MRRIRYGAKTENWTNDQRDLFNECSSAAIAAIETELANNAAKAALEKAARPKPERQRGRQALSEHVPRVDSVDDIASCDCGPCGKAPVKIGEDITEKLTIQAALFSVERHH